MGVACGGDGWVGGEVGVGGGVEVEEIDVDFEAEF